VTHVTLVTHVTHVTLVTLPQIRDKPPPFALNLHSPRGIQTTNAIGERRL